MKKLFITCSLFLSLTNSILAADREEISEEIMEVDQPSIPKRPLNLDQAIQDLNAGDPTNREAILNKLYNRFALTRQIANININQLFPSTSFEIFTPKEMTAFMIVSGRQNISLPPEFVAEVNNRVVQNDPTAQVILGGLHKYGWGGFRKDIDKAKEWYQRAASQKYPKAQVMLALIYYNHTAEDPKKSVETFNLLKGAAKQGDPTSISILIEMYSNKEIAEKDLPQVFQYFKDAEEKGDEDTQLIADIQHILAVMCYRRDGTSRDLSQIVKWLTKSAPYNIRSKFLLGVMYLKGAGVKEDQDKAIDYIKQAAQQGYKQAQDELNKLQLSQNKSG